MNQRILKTVTTSGSERIGLMMLIATLLVIVFTIGLVLHQQYNERSDHMSQEGDGIVRLLSHMNMLQLTGDNGSRGALRELLDSRLNPLLTYAAITDQQGHYIAAYERAASEVIQRSMPSSPSRWFGTYEYQAGDGEDYIEFHAPILEQGRLHGFVITGYIKPGYTLSSMQTRFMALVAMVIFFLTPLLYYLAKKEVQSLSQIDRGMRSLMGLIDFKSDRTDGELTPDESRQLYMHVLTEARVMIDSLESLQSNTIISSKLLIHQKSRLEDALNAIPFAVMIIDLSGEISYANNKVYTLLGAEPGKILGTCVEDWCHDKALLDHISSHQLATRANSNLSDGQRITLDKDGREVQISSCSLLSLKDSGESSDHLVLIDDSINTTADQRATNEFISHVAHELKSPLSVLSMYSEVLLDKDRVSARTFSNAANIIHSESRKMADMIDNLLNMSLMEKGVTTLSRKHVVTSDLLKDIFESMTNTEDAQELDLHSNIPDNLSPLLLDKELIRIAINNLMTNAIKYNKPGGRVDFDVTEDDDALTIRVSDSGIGISKEEQARIFDKFYRSDDIEAHAHKGHGLGLALVKQIVDMHHGSISVMSTHGEGSTFSIIINKDNTSIRGVAAS